MVEPGVYVTFFNEGEPFERELPPIGPLVGVVATHKQLVAERKTLEQMPDTGVSIDRWLEAEIEFQRATGEEPGGPRRTSMRLTAPEGVYLRFATFGEPREVAPVGELGPFAVVSITRRSVEADGTVVATRQASDLAPWDIASAAGDAYAGMHKPDIAFRTVGAPYHPRISSGPQPAQAPIVTPAPPTPAVETVYAPPSRPEAGYTPPMRPEPEYTPPPRREPEYTPPPRPTYSPPPPTEAAAPPEPPALTERDRELIERIERERAEDVLRARLQEEERRRLGVDDRSEAASTWSMRYRPAVSEEAATQSRPRFAFEWRALLWRMRFALIGVLLLGVGLYGITVARTGFAPGPQSQIKTVGIAEKISGPRWDYVVNGVQRVQAAGIAKPRGVYVAVRIGLTNKGDAISQTTPGDFTAIDSAGIQYTAESLQSDVYASPRNSTPYVWPQSFPAGRTVTTQLIFDVDPAAKGLQLIIADVPKTRVRLD